MPYTPLPEKNVGDPAVKEYFDLLMDNFSDHEERIDTFEVGAVKIPVFCFLVNNNSLTPNLTGVANYVAIQSMTVTSCVIQIFEKNGMTGTLEVDVKKSTTNLSNVAFESIFSTTPKIVMSSASDYQKSNSAIFNIKQTLVAGDTLRLDILSLPSNKIIEKFLVTCYGEL